MRILLLLFAQLVTLIVGTDVSSPGKYTMVQFEFPALTDSTRDDRKTPMKLHLPVAEGPFPVVIVSHGAGGNWDANFAQAQHLASHGYAALCLEHDGSNTKRMLAGGLRIGKTVADMTRDADEVLNRPKDVSFAIDQVIQWNRTHEQLRGKFNIKSIGVMGHSFGAYTTLAVCGARPALDWIQPKVGKGSGLGPDMFDRRVQCGVALSPQGPGDPFFLAESYQSIRVPLLGISGSRDKQQNFEPSHRKRSFQYKCDRWLVCHAIAVCGWDGRRPMARKWPGDFRQANMTCFCLPGRPCKEVYDVPRFKAGLKSLGLGGSFFCPGVEWVSPGEDSDSNANHLCLRD